MHLIAVHETAGASNPLGVPGYYDRVPFAPYYLFKDLITIFIFMFVLSIFVFFMPNVLGDSDNYIMANPMQTPAAIWRCSAPSCCGPKLPIKPAFHICS